MAGEPGGLQSMGSQRIRHNWVTNTFPFFNAFNRASAQASWVVVVVKKLSAAAADVRDMCSIPGTGRSPEKGMAAHSSILAWRIPWTEEPGRLQSMGSQRVGHD